jgi:Ulp1 family protease
MECIISDRTNDSGMTMNGQSSSSSCTNVPMPSLLFNTRMMPVDPQSIASAISALPKMLIYATSNTWSPEEVERMGPFIPAVRGTRTILSYWYNDNIINAAIEHMEHRDILQCSLDISKKPTMFLNSFFMSKLVFAGKGYTYAYVRRWTRNKPNIGTCGKVCTIIDLAGHWATIVVKFDERRIEFYDHLYQKSEDGKTCLDAMKRWVADEFHDKNDVTFDMSLWECEDMYGRIPIEALQTDHHSCGPFAVVCLELIVADLLWEQKKWYTQRDMQVHFRHRLLVEIHKGKIEY